MRRVSNFRLCLPLSLPYCEKNTVVMKMVVRVAEQRRLD